MSEDDLRQWPTVDLHAKSDTAAEETPTVGHNSAGDRIKAMVERVERLEEDKKAVAEDIKQVYKEAKATGFNNKILRKTVQLRRKPKAEREEEEHLLDLYMRALEAFD